MSTFGAFGEIKALVSEAVAELGERRVALGAVCSLTTIQIWRRCTKMYLQQRTVERVLPRMRRWETWIAGYEAGQSEIRRLEADPILNWDDVFCELRERLELAWADLSLYQIANGCEVPERMLMEWRLGVFTERHHRDALRGLGHLRHIYEWPAYSSNPADLVAHSLDL